MWSGMRVVWPHMGPQIFFLSCASLKMCVCVGAPDTTQMIQNVSAIIKTCSGCHIKLTWKTAEPSLKANNRRDTTVPQGKSVILLSFCIFRFLSYHASKQSEVQIVLWNKDRSASQPSSIYIEFVLIDIFVALAMTLSHPWQNHFERVEKRSVHFLFFDEADQAIELLSVFYFARKFIHLFIY